MKSVLNRPAIVLPISLQFIIMKSVQSFWFLASVADSRERDGGGRPPSPYWPLTFFGKSPFPYKGITYSSLCAFLINDDRADTSSSVATTL